MSWVQNYDPFASPLASTLLAALPVCLLLGLLVAGVAAHRAALAGMIVRSGIAILGSACRCPAFGSAGYGAAFGLLPIGWIVLAAVFLFHLTVRSGQFEIVKRSVAAISPDRRMQALLIAFSFGTLHRRRGRLRHAGGHLGAALLIGLGFSPLYAAGLALLANTSPVAFGAWARRSRRWPRSRASTKWRSARWPAGNCRSFRSSCRPGSWPMMSGWRGVRGCWPAILVCGGSFATLQFLVANFHGPTLVDVVGGLGSLVSLAVFLRFWQPAEIWRFRTNAAGQPDAAHDSRNGRLLTPGCRGAIVGDGVFVGLAVVQRHARTAVTAAKPNGLAGISTVTYEVPACTT